MKKYKLEIFLEDTGAVGVNQEGDELFTSEARVIMSVLEEYKQRMLASIMLTGQKMKTPEAKKAE